MKITILACLISMSVMPPIPAAAGKAPHRLAGFTLGADINDYQDRIRIDTMLPIRYLETIKEVETKELAAFQSGLVWYGTCASPGRIIRIKLKYADSSQSFYDELLKRFKARFGEPDEWRGDAFHVVVAWKWSFIDEEGNRISLMLQHNTEDPEEKVGNAVKLTLRNLLEEEARCFNKQHEDSGRPEPFGPVDWEILVPQ